MVADRMAARGERTNQILGIDATAHYQAQSFDQDGQTPLDHRTGLRGVEARVGVGAFRRSQLARVPPSRHALHRFLWVPDRRAEPFFPLCPRRSSWIRCLQAGVGIPPARVAEYAPSGIIPTRSQHSVLTWRTG